MKTKFRLQASLPRAMLYSASLLLCAAPPASAATPAPASSSATPASAKAPAGPGAAAPNAPPVNVSVTRVQRQDVPVVLETQATVAPVANVDVRAQISAVISAVHVQEGQMVKAGQLLFSLDARSEQAALERNLAQLQKDQAQLEDLQRQAKRNQELLAQNFVSRGAADNLATQVAAQQASIKLAQAAVKSARVALDYSQIRAPMDGRIGAINVYPGSLAQPGLSLLQLTRLDPIDISFSAPESRLRELLAAHKAGLAQVEVLPNGAPPLRGKLHFIDNSVDGASGNIRVKARFANPQQSLWPGQTVQARLTVDTLKNAVVAPLAAVVINAKGRAVYTVEADQSVKLQPVKLLYSFGQMAVLEGLSGNEKVVVEGKQNLRPGGKIKELPSAVTRSDEKSAVAGKGGA
ncbi:efflux RND transporter periplasmic adaptor subunit [Massilia sp. W12]|uniref:efflux RND transporter periplasmic adaptor subunit n=1 Tax=Massilia sp. W12 TaxID=3126507 RepID=UPI0030CAE614